MRRFRLLCVSGGLGTVLALLMAAAPARGADCNQNGRSDDEDLAPSAQDFSAPVDLVLAEPFVGFFWVGAVADMDGDARRDLVVGDAGADEVSILSNRVGSVPPGALFTVLSKFRLSAGLRSVTASDLNDDGRADLVLGLDQDGQDARRSIQIRMGTPSGEYTASDLFPLDDAGYLGPILPGDLNGDGQVDLVVDYSGPVILLNRGNGRFDPPTRVFTRLLYLHVLADLDGDRDLDLAGTNASAFDFVTQTYIGGDVLLVRNRGDGTFEPPAAFHVGGSTEGLSTADLDGDGDLDLAVERAGVGSEHGTHSLVLLRNNGQGSFNESLSLEGNPDVTGPRTGDFDGDGDPDIVTATYGEARVNLWWNRGDGSFETPRRIALSGGITRASVADLDGDGLDDIATSPFVSGHPVASFIFGRRRGASLDCDKDGIPDECVAAGEGVDCRSYLLPHECAGDCDFDGRSDACEIRAKEEPDCDANAIPDTCENAGVSAADCDGDGVFDYCEPDEDCNRDGVGDSCQGLYDGDGNGVPDDCEERPISFRVAFDAPETVSAPPRGLVRTEATVLLQQEGLVPGEAGAAGWTLFMKAEGCDIVGITDLGTDAGAYYQDGFRALELTFCRCPGGYLGAISSTFLSLKVPVTLPPRKDPRSILRLTLEGAAGEDGGCAPCTLGLVEVDDCNRCHRGQPLQNFITYREESFTPSYEQRTLRFCPAVFHRGDANGDGALDITDPITVLRYLFQGVSRPPCLEAANAQDDERLDIADAVHLLHYLFGNGPPPPAPGPPEENCGSDPAESPTFLGCEGYTGC